ncbi:MAG: class I SAM-dependent methyltransferase [Gemmataceae bacterium]
MLISESDARGDGKPLPACEDVRYNSSMNDQAHSWSEAAAHYEDEFVDPYRAGSSGPLFAALDSIVDARQQVVADLGCGIGPLLPELAHRFSHVHAIDFAPGMLARARQRCADQANITFHERRLTDLAPLVGKVDVAVAINSLVQPTVCEIEAVLEQIRHIVRPGGRFLGIVPAIDAVHYHTMLLLDRARRAGMPEAAARRNAAQNAEHVLYDFAFGGFSYTGLEQHFWQPFEIRYRLERAGFVEVREAKIPLAWEQFAGGADLRDQPPPWDWFFEAEG